jgi:hypothetical protein
MKRTQSGTNVRRVILDVLKPHNPTIIELTQTIASLEGVSGVNCVVEEVDQETESIKLTIEGLSIVFEEVQKVIESMGGAIHSIDSVSVGRKMVECGKTLKDRSREV